MNIKSQWRERRANVIVPRRNCIDEQLFIATVTLGARYKMRRYAVSRSQFDRAAYFPSSTIQYRRSRKFLKRGSDDAKRYTRRSTFIVHGNFNTPAFLARVCGHPVWVARGRGPCKEATRSSPRYRSALSFSLSLFVSLFLSLFQSDLFEAGRRCSEPLSRI